MTQPTASTASYELPLDRVRRTMSFHAPIQESGFPGGCFDLVYTWGVLLHIEPAEFVDFMKKWEYSRRYILIGEYFSRTPASIPYHNATDWKCESVGGERQEIPGRIPDDARKRWSCRSGDTGKCHEGGPRNGRSYHSRRAESVEYCGPGSHWGIRAGCGDVTGEGPKSSWQG